MATSVTETVCEDESSVTVDGEVFTEKRHVRFVRDMEDAGIEVIVYSGRGMYGEYCPAVLCGDEGPSEQEVYRATKARLSRDSMGLGTVLYAR